MLQPRSKKAYVDYLNGLQLGPADWMKKDVLKANYACARDPKAAWITVDVPACEVKGTLAQGANDQQVAAIPVDGVRQKLVSSEPPVILDVRNSEELTGELGHIPDAINIRSASFHKN
ncbi:rhodanese-like domain-containing protein [Candidatus Nitrospira salsa]